ncbi:MAG: hypothetical protein Q7J80_13090, partial [Anaerolineales bacterium]|nr:hypothetical protein [Anaerolineales bacterium]
MIAKVYPLKRMSRRLSVFDYTVPVGMEVKRGDIVCIPFRSSVLFGVVARVTDMPVRGIRLKALQSKSEDGSLREEELSFFEDLAFDLAQSVSSLLYVCLPLTSSTSHTPTALPVSPSPLVFSDREYQTAETTAKILKTRKKAFVHLDDLRSSALLLRAYALANPQAALVAIVPTVRDSHLLMSHLSELHPLLVTGQESLAQRF